MALSGIEKKVLKVFPSIIKSSKSCRDEWKKLKYDESEAFISVLCRDMPLRYAFSSPRSSRSSSMLMIIKNGPHKKVLILKAKSEMAEDICSKFEILIMEAMALASAEIGTVITIVNAIMDLKMDTFP